MSISANKLDLAEVATVLNHSAIGHTIEYRPQVSSTMPLAHERAVEPQTRSGTMIVTDEQTAGRGRSTRRWITPAGEALLTSLILKPPFPVPFQQLPMVAGLAALDAIRAVQPLLGQRVGLKWPNDLLVGTDMYNCYKVGGILMEARFTGSDPSHVVIGMGINVDQSPVDLPPSVPGAPPPLSLNHFAREVVAHGDSTSGTTVMPSYHLITRTALLIALCQAWNNLLTPHPHLSQMVLARWRNALWTLGNPVIVQERDMAQRQSEGGGESEEFPSVLCEGTAVDVTDGGQLQVLDAAGHTHLVDAGDVSLRMANFGTNFF